MHHNVRLIDVTLRDGGYRNNFDFRQDYIDSHLESVAGSGVDFVEIGYRNGPQTRRSTHGPTGICGNGFLDRLATTGHTAKLCIIAHLHNITTADIDDLADRGVAVFRLCCSKANVAQARPLLEHARTRGMVVCGNITRTSELDLTDVLTLAKDITRAGAHVVYLADSNGSIQPKRLATLVESVIDYTQAEVGFHAHDHLGLAMVNSIAALDSGASFVDASLFGVGKGAGNLRLETWLLYIEKRLDKSCSLERVMKQAMRLPTSVLPKVSQDHLLDIICANYDISLDKRNDIVCAASDIQTIIQKARNHTPTYEKLLG